MICKDTRKRNADDSLIEEEDAEEDDENIIHAS